MIRHFAALEFRPRPTSCRKVRGGTTPDSRWPPSVSSDPEADLNSCNGSPSTELVRVMEPSDAGSDERLLELLRADPVAFEGFYRRHVAGVMRFLATRCQSPEDVADATAATFLAVLVSSSTFDPTLGSPTAWLYTIARNEASLQKRSSNRRRLLSSRMQARQLLSNDDTERIAEIIDAERRAEDVLEVLSSAPKGECELVARIVSDDTTPSAAARALGISSGAGRIRLMRLRARVHAALVAATPRSEPQICARESKEQQ